MPSLTFPNVPLPILLPMGQRGNFTKDVVADVARAGVARVGRG